MAEHFDARIVRRWAAAGVHILKAHRGELNALNVFPVPDGDTGTNLYLTFSAAAAAELQRTGHIDDAADALAAMARGALLGARGNSGVILAQTLRGFAELAAEESGRLSLSRILSAGAIAARSAVAQPLEGTALTVVDAAAATIARDPSVAAAAARETLGRTPEMLEALKLAGVVDAGGRGVVLLLDALTAVWHDEVVDSPAVGFVPDSVPHSQTCTADARFEVMFLTESVAVDQVQTAIAQLGVSLAVTSGPELSQVHIHTDQPRAVITAAEQYSLIRNIRIELLEHSVTSRRIVAQVFGSGVVQLCAEAGVVVVAAEPDIRPSVQEFVAAGLKSQARELILLPSDADSVKVAQLAATELRDDGCLVEVVETISLQQTLAAIAVSDPAADFADEIALLQAAANETTSIAVTHASRDSDTPLGQIKTGEFLGFCNGALLSTSQDLVDAVCAVVSNLPEPELITLISGRLLQTDELADVQSALEIIFPEAEQIVIEGRQEVWPLLMGFE